MPDRREDMTILVVERLADVPRASWDACAGADNPFLCYDFLEALESSGCISRPTGWAPRHMVIRDLSGDLLACAPLYLKDHSAGEYIFDQGWAEAYQRAGGAYYPKLLSAVPFTPVTGPRLLVRPDLPDTLQTHLKRRLAEAMKDLAVTASLSSVHVNFIPEGAVSDLQDAGFLPRENLQYHWNNNNYEDYSNFLDDLSSRKRKALKKERRQVAEAGLYIERLTGTAITSAHWDAMYGFYQDTSARKWGQTYLNRETFRLIGERLADRVLLVMASRGDRIIAGALNLIGRDTLYGRYWGCCEDVRSLHFELCYHQAIEFAIERGLKRVEAGAQGEHKIARGYLPTLTHSAHFITDPGLRAAVAEFLDQERPAVRQHLKRLMTESPYRQSPDTV